ncbi:MAG TPA: di-heme oxidoredictase family protein [Pseudomonadales bacterium]
MNARLKQQRRYYPAAALAAALLAACGGGGGSNAASTTAGRIEHLPGGDATTPYINSTAYSKPSRNMTDGQRIIAFNNGNHFFENPWVEGSASTEARDGLGPYFNNRACQNCHVNDGRGHAAATAVDGISQGADFSSLLIRVSRSLISHEDKALIDASLLAKVPDSTAGGQLQHRAAAGVQNEAELAVSYTPVSVAFADGTEVILRQPVWHLQSNIGDFDDDSVFSARVAPPMIGLGLLALIDENTIYLQQDINDSNNDGISGKANIVYSQQLGGTTLGRFGWKAGQPNLIEQSAGAFHEDMGLTSRFHSEENCYNQQADCLAAPNGNGDDNHEVTDSILNLVNFYTHHLAVPARRNAYDSEVQQGKQLFTDIGCAACHTPRHTTIASTEHPELSQQVIFPYTDLLLHDMGEALADFTLDNQPADADIRVEYQATAREWRTAPLWGLGLAQTVDPNASFLHDGRARTIMEAVLWHGGEAQPARDRVLQLDAGQRATLLAFLQDL